MKILKIITFLVAIVISQNAVAKTSGAYYGISLIKTNIEAGNYNDSTGSSVNNRSARNISNDDQISVGLNYKIAFNILGFYVAPGVFYDFANVSQYDDLGHEWELDTRIGLRVDGGYDLTRNLSGYVFTGYASNNISINNSSGTSSSNEIDPFYGLGVKYSVLGNIDVNLEYEFSGYRTPAEYINSIRAKQEFDSQIARLGVSFSF